MGDVDARWEPYQALHASLILLRAGQVLEPPAGVTLDLRDGVLVAEGRATFRWIDRAQALARSIAGVRGFNAEKLVDEDQAQITAIQSQVEGQIFRFLVGAPDLWPGQGNRIDALVSNITNLRQAAAHRNQHITIEIRGYTDSTGDPQRDMRDSMDLANSFFETLRWHSVDMTIFTKRGMGAAQPAAQSDASREANNRLVSFKVNFEGY